MAQLCRLSTTNTSTRALPRDEGDYRRTGRHTWATSCRALVEKNLKAGSGGGERVPGERGMREKVRRGVLFEGLGEREPGERESGAQGAAREE